MKRYILTLSFLIIGFYACMGAKDKTTVATEGPYNISIQIDGLSSEDVGILAYYFGDSKYIKDTLQFDDNGVAYIDDTTTIPTGIYLLAIPKLKLTYFELVLGEERNFSMKTDTLDMVGNMTITNSIENQLFYDNLKYMVDIGVISEKLKEEINSLEEGTDAYKNVYAELEKIDAGVKSYRAKAIKKAPNAFYSKLLSMMTEVELPKNPNKSDSAFAYNFYQKHYFDNIDLTDSRLTRTPILLSKIRTFLDYYTIPVPDSINAAADKILQQAESDYEMFQFCLQGIFNKYAKSKVMSHELVYVYLVDKYYSNPEKVDWVSDEQRAKMIDVVERKKPTLLGAIAPDIIIADINNEVRKLHTEAEANDYTILVFWNSTCGHCKTEMPILKELYIKEIKELGDIDIFAISTEVSREDWLAFIDEKELVNPGWIHCMDPFGSNPFRVKYDVVSTPIVIILDKNKKILAKRINLEDVAGLIEYDINKAE